MISKQILSEVSTMSREDLLTLNKAMKIRMNTINFENTTKFRVGNSVMFSDKKGYTLTGTITKINTKTIKVKATNGVTWSVSPSLLKAA